MTLLPPEFDVLPDDAHIRIVSIEGGIDDTAAKPMLAVLRELLGQWRERGAITAGAAALAVGGHFLVVAYQPADGDLSGCTKDKLTHTLMMLESQLGRRMLAAPRLAVASGDGTVDFMTNLEFRERRRSGEVQPDTRVYDHLLTRLGDLRAGSFETTVERSWYARIGAGA